MLFDPLLLANFLCCPPALNSNCRESRRSEDRSAERNTNGTSNKASPPHQRVLPHIALPPNPGAPITAAAPSSRKRLPFEAASLESSPATPPCTTPLRTPTPAP